MKLPQVRAELRRLANDPAMPPAFRIQLSLLAEEITRRTSDKPERQIARPMSPDLERAIRDYVDAHPSLAQVEVARLFGVNQGRVSEVIHGKRS